MNKGTSLSEYTMSIKAELEAIESVGEVILFCGQISDEDQSMLSLQPGYPTVLLTSVGGKLNKGPNPGTVECDAAFGVYVIGDIDSNTMGFSNTAMELTEKVVAMVAANKIGKANPGAVRPPENVEMMSFPSPVKNGTQYATWYCIFNQRILLRATT